MMQPVLFVAEVYDVESQKKKRNQYDLLCFMLVINTS